MAMITDTDTISPSTTTISITDTTAGMTGAIMTDTTRNTESVIMTDTTRNTESVIMTAMATPTDITASSAVTMMITVDGDMTATGNTENVTVTDATGAMTIVATGTGTGVMAVSAEIHRPVFGILDRRDACYHLSSWQPLLAWLFPGAVMNGGDRTLAAAVFDIQDANSGTELAVQDKDHNNQALEEFFANQEEKAFYVAYAALWHRETAMDVVQESMLRLIQYYREKPAEQWPALFRTILNSRINDVRRKRLLEQGKHKLISLTGLFRKDQEERHAMDEYEIPSAERTDGITAPEVEAVTTELRHKVEEALQALSERQRQVFILREWRGMTIKETSLTLGCSENSVKQHHFRALRELRKQLAEVWDHE